jgi:hypothetical protein
LSIFGQPQALQDRRRGLRLLASLYSLILHGGLVGILFFLPPGTFFPSDPPSSVYQSVVVPLEKEHKVIWYRFEKQLPAISPSTPASTPGRTEQKASQRIVTDPSANPGKQLVWVPAPRLELENDLTAPNVVALQPPAMVLPPDKPQPKAFQAPAPQMPQQTARTPELPSAPAIALKDDETTELADALINRPVGAPRRNFTAPPGAGKTTAPGPAPSLPTAPSLEEGGGTANVSVVIIGVNPANVPQPPAPEGGRPARISAGPDSSGTGPAQLTGGNSSLVVPGVSVSGAPEARAVVTRSPSLPKGSAPAPGIGRPQMPDQSAVFQSTPHVSVAQWPHARSLPPAIERQFANRVVYTTLIPSARSGGDWVVWFAEETVTPADVRLLMRPPSLLHSAPLPPVPGQTDHGTGKLVITGIIAKDGQFDASLASADPWARDLVEALHAWRFNPAVRNGVAIDVEATIEIPLVFSAAK